MNTGVIDNFTNVFTTYIDSGFGLLKGEVAYLASTLIVIDITLAGLFWAWAVDEDVLAHLVKKTLYIGFFAFLIGNFNGLAQIIYNSFAGIGLKAAGSNLSAAQLAQPGRVAQEDRLIALRRQNELAEAETPIDTDVDLGSLRFRYTIDGDTPPWRPLKAFDDGHKVYIEFPRGIGQGELPPLFVVSADGKSSDLVNYRMRGNHMIVDRLFAAAELRLGDGASERRVRIVRAD